MRTPFSIDHFLRTSKPRDPGVTWHLWIDDIFQAKCFKERGEPVRRRKAYVEKHGGLQELKAACKHYRAALLENGNQYVILAFPTVEILYKE